ncbi:hypothetical protein BDF22DRAFT_697177 [Syncephalis plumigaleata]|nr:hypothetical protein BDF22DRAFT_697177 [Syncephalis plumigaleata]
MISSIEYFFPFDCTLLLLFYVFAIIIVVISNMLPSILHAINVQRLRSWTSVIVVVLLLLSPIVDAIPMGAVLSTPESALYMGQRFGVDDAFGQEGLIVTNVLRANGITDYLLGYLNGKPSLITCGRIGDKPSRIHDVYRTLESPRPVAKELVGGKRFFAQSKIDFSIPHMHCYVSSTVCTASLSDHISILRTRVTYAKRRKEAIRIGKQIASAIKYMKAIGWAYNFKLDNMYLDKNNNLALVIYEDAVHVPPPDKTDNDTIDQLLNIDTEIENRFMDLGETFYAGDDMLKLAHPFLYWPRSLPSYASLNSNSRNNRDASSNTRPLSIANMSPITPPPKALLLDSSMQEHPRPLF